MKNILRSFLNIEDNGNLNIKVDSITPMSLEPIKPTWGKSHYFSGLNPDTKRRRVNRNVEFAPQEYNLDKVSALYHTEAYFRQSVEKIVQRLFRHDITVVGDDKAVEYIKRRIAFLESSMGLPFREFLEQISRNLIKYHNCFVEKIRNKKAPKRMWRVTAWGKTISPVINYNIVYAPSMRLAVCQHGRVIKYLQAVQSNIMGNWIEPSLDNSEFPNWNPEDMIHMAIDVESNYVFGNPVAGPVVDDVRAWRKMEEAAEIIVFQFAKPILHYKIEGPKPANKEIRDAERVLKRMSSSGFLVSHGNTSIEYVGANKSAINVVPSLEYFRKRVRTGLGADPITMGEDNIANRATAQTMTEGMIFLVEFYQRRLKEFFRWYFLREWLQEGRIAGDVELFFPEIDITAKQTRETHATFMFLQNMITHEEARREIGRMPLSNNKDLHIERVDMPLSEHNANLETKLKKVDLQKRANAATTRVAPINQYGQKPKPKSKQDTLSLLNPWKKALLDASIQTDFYEGDEDG